MPLQVKCPNPACRGVSVLDDKLVGADTRCKACGTTFHVTAPPTVAPRPAPSTIQPVAAAKQTQDSGTSPAISAKPAAASGSSKRIGRFEIRARLGAGAFGVVYRAFDPQLKREVALKVLHPEMLNHPDRVARFQREARSAAQLRHANIVPVFDIGQDGSHYYIASAYIPGQTLHDALDDKPMPFQRAARIVRDLADAVGYAHQQGVVHRDLKPANILLDEKDSPQLVDFGLSARQETEPQEKANRLTRLGAVLGTPAYMAPEQAGGQTGEVQPAADQYSLGIILYELLCGRPPFEGPPALVLYNVLHKEPATPCSVNASVPPELELICLKAMARRPEDRYADCQALADALRRWLEGPPTAIPTKAPQAVQATVAPTASTWAVDGSVSARARATRSQPKSTKMSGLMLGALAGGVAALLLLVGTVAVGAIIFLKGRGSDKVATTDSAHGKNSAATDKQPDKSVGDGGTKPDKGHPVIPVIDPPDKGPAGKPLLPIDKNPQPQKPAMPDEAAQAAAEKAIKEEHKDDYAKRKPADIQAKPCLAVPQESRKTRKGSSETRFVLLREARDSGGPRRRHAPLPASSRRDGGPLRRGCLRDEGSGPPGGRPNGHTRRSP